MLKDHNCPKSSDETSISRKNKVQEADKTKQMIYETR
jgi:hypothetical protein